VSRPPDRDQKCRLRSSRLDESCAFDEIRIASDDSGIWSHDVLPIGIHQTKTRVIGDVGSDGGWTPEAGEG
jgi:hypothetical protein